MWGVKQANVQLVPWRQSEILESGGGMDYENQGWMEMTPTRR